MKLTKYTKYKDMLIAINAFSMTEQTLKRVMKFSEQFAIPDELQKDFREWSFGQLTEVQALKAENLLTEIFMVLCVPKDLRGTKTESKFSKRLMRMPAVGCLHAVVNIQKDLLTIVKLFEAIKYKPTQDEQAAGISDQPGTMHSVADWYARRQGIQNPEDVYRTPWILIYEALKIDNAAAAFRRRYQQRQQMLSKIAEPKQSKFRK